MMSKCPSCGGERIKNAVKCTHCGQYFSKVIELIAAEEAEEELLTFSGQCKRILKSGQIKAELVTEYKKFRAGLSRKGVFTLYVILAFVFLLTVSVL
jgi:predicted ATP-dependent serine protease